MIEFAILGPLEARRAGEPLKLGGRNQRAVLALLLLQANRVVSIERLAEELYGTDTPVSAVTQVHRQVSELRRVLDAQGAADESVIETRPPGYLIRVDSDGARPAPLRGSDDPGRGGDRERSAGRGGDAARSALALARRAAGRPRVRAVRPGPDRTARGAAARRRRAPHRGGAGAGWPCRGRARAARPRRRASAARAAARAADARPVPVRPSGRGTGGLPLHARGACSGVRRGAAPGAETPGGGDPAPRPRAGHAVARAGRGQGAGRAPCSWPAAIPRASIRSSRLRRRWRANRPASWSSRSWWRTRPVCRRP